MKFIEFYEVNFGEYQIIPLMTAKYFSSFERSLDYAREVRDKLKDFVLKDETNELVADDSLKLPDNHRGAKLTLVFETFSGSLRVYEIIISRHTYCLED